MSFVEHSNMIWTKYHYIDLAFYTSCLHEHPRKESRQEKCQAN